MRSYQRDPPIVPISILWPTDASDSLLSPLGQHRRRHVKPSKGKWARRKERKAKKASQAEHPQTTAPEIPPVPELSDHINVGLPSITRRLQEVAAHPSPDDGTAGEPPRPYSAVFVVLDGQSSAFWSHMPQMVGVAAHDLPAGQKTRLVGIPESCGPTLSDCLAIPRASSIGVKMGAPGAAALIDYVNKSVPEVDIAWLGEAAAAQFRATSINPVQTFVGAKRAKRES